MHPAYSIIFFTTASGLGYGLFTVGALLAAAGVVPAERGFGIAVLVPAAAFVVFGLLSSTLHLGHPERAWRAFGQWRSSWLSREGVMAVVTFVPVLVLALGWIGYGTISGGWAVAALLTAVGAAVTVYCTGMIYASLKAVPRWHSPRVPANYLLLGLATGAVWFDAIARYFDLGSGVTAAVAALSLLAAWAAKAGYWHAIDTAPPAVTAGSATGLSDLGTVRLLEPPHTRPNYLQKEMGYRVARKHAAKLRRLVHLFLFLAPLVLTAAAFFLDHRAGLAAMSLAALSVALGAVIERWLFFAEAVHAVSLYYGAEAA